MQMETSAKTPNPVSSVKSSSLKDWFVDDFYPRYDKQLWQVLGAIVLAVAVYFIWSYNHQKSQTAENKKLGAAYVLLARGNLADGEKALNEFLATGPSGLARDKANLYLGKAYYDQQQYDLSLAAYGKVGKDGKATALVYSGALHGIAACYMQKKDYAQAVTTLDAFVKFCMRRTGNPKENMDGEEVMDLSPAVPIALWIEALCYRELGQPDQVKAVVATLQKAYPDSPEAQDGMKLLALTE